MDQRASDTEREQTAEALREHFAAGRLTDDELDERVQATYAARTEADLARLLDDLPKLPATRQEQKAELIERRGELRRRLIHQTGGSLTAFLVCTVVWVATGANGQFWPIWVALVALIPLAKNGWDLYGPAPQLDRVEAELARRERRDRAREAHRDVTRRGALERHERRTLERRARRERREQ